MRNLLLLCLTIILALPLNAQRRMENLNRDLVAQKTAAGVFLSWRITGQEYYDVTYNVYRDGVKITASTLTVSNYVDAQGTTSSQYSVAAVVRGKEQQPCKAVAVWEHDYLEIPMGGVKSRRGYDITDQYEPNDACAADLDGNGELEIILKRINHTDQNALFPTDNDSAYTVLEAYSLARAISRDSTTAATPATTTRGRWAMMTTGAGLAQSQEKAHVSRKWGWAA